MIHRIQNVYTLARDMDRQQAFYGNALGFKTKFRDQSAWVQFAVGGSNFALSSVAEGAAGMSGSVAVFESSDLPGVRECVEMGGGVFCQARDMGPHGSVFTFADPEGNVFQVFSRA